MANPLLAYARQVYTDRLIEAGAEIIQDDEDTLVVDRGRFMTVTTFNEHGDIIGFRLEWKN